MSQMVRISYRARTAVTQMKDTLVPLEHVSRTVVELNRDHMDITGIQFNAYEKAPPPTISTSMLSLDRAHRTYTVEFLGQQFKLTCTEDMSVRFVHIPVREGITAVEANTLIQLVQRDATGRVTKGTFGRL